MPRVLCFQIAGLDLWFNPDDHAPPHFHARKPGEWIVKVDIESSSEKNLVFQVVWCRGVRRVLGAYRRRLAHEVAVHQEKLVAEWEQRVHEKETRR
jgi:hypothetical protein